MKSIVVSVMLLLGSILMTAQQREQLPYSLQPKIQSITFSSDSQSDYVFKDGRTDVPPSKCIVRKNATGLPIFDIEVFRAARSQYGVTMRWTTNEPVRKGDVLLARVSMRTLSACQESGESVVFFYFQDARPPHDKSFISQLGAGLAWKTFNIPFIASKDADAGDALVELAFGSLAQHVEVTGVEVLNFGNSVVKEDLPETRFTYNGRETGATWREKALQRIEEIRTAPLTVKVIDSEGKPVHKAEVEIKMTRSDFIWGTAINEATLAGTDSVSDIYRMRLLELFNTGGIENGFKSGGWFWEPERKLNTLRSFEWLEKNGFRQRGHNLVWPGWKFNPSTTRYIAEHDSPDVFERFIKAQFYERMAYTKGRVIAWDVINEPMHEKDFFKILPPSVMVDWFKLARRLDPNAQLFINDYSMLNCVESPQNIKDYMKLIRDLRAQGAPIDAVGIQGHVGRQPRDPEQVLSDLDLLIPLGLPVQITEFDINTPDEELQADYTRDFLIAVYSHPVITGVTLWGFWEAKHWKPDAAMFRKDWTPKPNAKVWREWVTGKWKTHATAMTNDKGTVSMRGHLGEYAIYVCCQGKSTKVMCHLGKNGQEIVVNLD